MCNITGMIIRISGRDDYSLFNAGECYADVISVLMPLLQWASDKNNGTINDSPKGNNRIISFIGDIPEELITVLNGKDYETGLLSWISNNMNVNINMVIISNNDDSKMTDITWDSTGHASQTIREFV